MSTGPVSDPFRYSQAMAKVTALTQDLCSYMIRNRSPEGPILTALRQETIRVAGEFAGMMISEEQGVLLRILVGALAPRHAVEVGTFTGYSAACIASALPSGGKLVCCDVSHEWTAVGAQYWKRFGVAEKIDLRIAPALDTLSGLPGNLRFDFAFLDADKANYIAYFEAILPRMRKNGMIAVDNVLWHNWPMHASRQDEETVGIREFNEHVLNDDRVDSVMLHVGDGLTLIRKL